MLTIIIMLNKFNQYKCMLFYVKENLKALPKDFFLNTMIFF